MTPLPKRKLSTRRQGDRRAHISLGDSGRTVCPHCHGKVLSHQVCPRCGYYKGKLIKSPKQKETTPHQS